MTGDPLAQWPKHALEFGQIRQVLVESRLGREALAALIGVDSPGVLAVREAPNVQAVDSVAVGKPLGVGARQLADGRIAVALQRAGEGWADAGQDPHRTGR